jgi:hypothetical protein
MSKGTYDISDINDYTLSDWKKHLKGVETYSPQNIIYIEHLREKIKILENFDMELEDLESETIQMMVERDVLNEKIYENKEQIESLEKLKLNK